MRKINIVEYDFSWPKHFAEEKKLLQGALEDIVIAIHHVGSTAVSGLAAKPIIDILVEVTDLKALDAHNAGMEAVGYTAKGEFGISGRRYFQKGGDARTHQVHAFVSGDNHVMRHIAFRDYLISHPLIAEEYGELKKSVALTCDNDIGKYCNGKDAFVKHHEALAVKSHSPNKALHQRPTSAASDL